MVLLIFAGGWGLGISCRSAGLLRGLVLDSCIVVAGAAPAVACVGPRMVSVLSVSVVAQFPDAGGSAPRGPWTIFSALGLEDEDIRSDVHCTAFSESGLSRGATCALASNEGPPCSTARWSAAGPPTPCAMDHGTEAVRSSPGHGGLLARPWSGLIPVRSSGGRVRNDETREEDSRADQGVQGGVGSMRAGRRGRLRNTSPCVKGKGTSVRGRCGRSGTFACF